jgi:hypothetical protein
VGVYMSSIFLFQKVLLLLECNLPKVATSF